LNKAEGFFIRGVEEVPLAREAKPIKTGRTPGCQGGVASSRVCRVNGRAASATAF
jgi:hypothetical protein